MRQELAQLGNGAHALAIQILGNPEDAADAVHDAFATALARPGAYDPGRGPFKPWFLRVVRNRCIDLLRRRRPTGVDVELLPDPGVSPVDRVQKQERDASLRRALGALNPDHRPVLCRDRGGPRRGAGHRDVAPASCTDEFERTVGGRR